MAAGRHAQRAALAMQAWRCGRRTMPGNARCAAPRERGRVVALAHSVRCRTQRSARAALHRAPQPRGSRGGRARAWEGRAYCGAVPAQRHCSLLSAPRRFDARHAVLCAGARRSAGPRHAGAAVACAARRSAAAPAAQPRRGARRALQPQARRRSPRGNAQRCGPGGYTRLMRLHSRRVNFCQRRRRVAWSPPAGSPFRSSARCSARRWSRWRGCWARSSSSPASARQRTVTLSSQSSRSVRSGAACPP